MEVTKYKPFLWKDSINKFHRPEDMRTDRIFYILRMIWNHSVPNDMQLKPFKRYKFSSFYSEEYMKLAIRALLYELTKRDDLTSYFIKCLNLMCNYRKMIAM